MPHLRRMFTGSKRVDDWIAGECREEEEFRKKGKEWGKWFEGKERPFAFSGLCLSLRPFSPFQSTMPPLFFLR